MSAGAPAPSVDLLTPQGQTHGPGHVRGHSRSREHVISPAPSSEQLNHEKRRSRNFAYINDQALSHNHIHSRSRSPLPDDSHDFTSIPLVNGDTNVAQSKLGESMQLPFESETIEPSSRSNEVVEGLLVTLPWIAISWFAWKYFEWGTFAATDDYLKSASPSGLGQVTLKACILTSTTLLMTGCWQVLQLDMQDGRFMNLLIQKSPQFHANTIRRSFLQICSVGLPVYACLKVGGFLVSFFFSLAFASGISTIREGGFKGQLKSKKLTLSMLASVILIDSLSPNSSWDQNPVMSYMALLLSAFIIRPPFFGLQGSSISEPVLDLSSKDPGFGTSSYQRKLSSSNSASIAGQDNAVLAIFSGLFLATVTIFSISLDTFSFGLLDVLFVFLVAGIYSFSLLFSQPSTLRSPQKIGLAVGTATGLLCAVAPGTSFPKTISFRGIIAVLSFMAAKFDNSNSRHGHDHQHDRPSRRPSQVSKFIIALSEPYPMLHSILREKDSRRIFYFMCLNFLFMLVQLAYGFLTGSLGLLSDSIHMFFDCLALVVGLFAAVMSKWPPSPRFPYGYGKVDTLSGFANGIFLMIISIEISYEAVERLFSGSQMNRIGELLVISLAGLGVNIVGIMSFEHGHDHGHEHGHSHDHGNENMHGIFLHILADTLGSVAVVISTILIHFYGWPGFDPLASCVIAILIFASAVPLVTSTAKRLLLALPADVEYNLRDTLAGVSTLRGVSGYAVPRFWLDDTASGDNNHDHDHDHCDDGRLRHHDHGHSHSHSHSHCHDHDHSHSHSCNHNQVNPIKILGVIHIFALRSFDLDDVRQRTLNYLKERNMDILVQVEREGDGRCWCGGGLKTS